MKFTKNTKCIEKYKKVVYDKNKFLETLPISFPITFPEGEECIFFNRCQYNELILLGNDSIIKKRKKDKHEKDEKICCIRVSSSYGNGNACRLWRKLKYRRRRK